MISLHVSVPPFFFSYRKYTWPVKIFILFASCLSGMGALLQQRTDEYPGGRAQKEMDLSLLVTYYWDSPNTEAIQGEAPASINPIGLCKHREGPETASSRERSFPCDKLS